jgi:hypothetical protein
MIAIPLAKDTADFGTQSQFQAEPAVTSSLFLLAEGSTHVGEN